MFNQKKKSFQKKSSNKRYIRRKRLVRGISMAPVDHLRESRNCKKFDKIKQSYNKGRKTYLFLRNIHDNSISNTFLRKELFNSKFRRDIFVNVLIKPLYKLDILL